MFTGLIREVGTFRRIAPRPGGAGLEISCPSLAPDVRLGDSVCVDGACLTAEEVMPTGFVAFATAETLRRTTLAALRPGGRVNLEPALTASDRLGGHMVQGHVEGVAEVLSLCDEGEGAVLAVRVPKELLPAVIPKGSIALSGISLTVAKASADRVEIALIPSTLRATTLPSWEPGTRVNVETDLVGRHIVKYMDGLGLKRGLSVEDLVRKGF